MLMMDRYLTMAGISLGICFPIVVFTQPAPNNIETFNVRINGITGAPLQNVWNRLNAQKALIADRFTKEYVFEFYKKIPQEIQKGIEPFGYFQSQIHSQLIRNDATWFAIFTVDPGPQTVWGTINFQIIGIGRDLPALQDLYQKFPIQAGAAFNAKIYNDFKNKLLNTANDYGFFQAKFVTSKIEVDLKKNTANLIMVFDTGERSRFGSTTFSSSPFAEAFLNRYVKYRISDYFDQNKIRQTRIGLMNSNYFSTVIVTPHILNEIAGIIPITIQLKTQPRKQYSAAFGYGTDTGVRTFFGADWRWVNPYGHRFNSFLLVSKFYKEFINTYYIPGKDPAIDQYIISSNIFKQQQVKNQEHALGTSLSGGYQTYLGNWQLLILLNALAEKYTIRHFPRAKRVLFYPSMTWQRLYVDKALNPSAGYRFLLSLLGSGNFFQARLDSRFLFTLFHRTRFILNGSLGHLSIKNLNNLPMTLQFFIGGPQNLRGYRYNAIGPGKNLFFASIEIQQKIVGMLYLAGFYNVGNVSNNILHEKLKQGAGPSIVLMTPMGIIEVTAARALGQPGHPWLFQLNMGASL